MMRWKKVLSRFIPKVKSILLEKIIDYCVHYQKEEMQEFSTPLMGDTIDDNVKPAWYTNYFKECDVDTLCDMVVACNYKNIKPLNNLCCLAIVLLK